MTTISVTDLVHNFADACRALVPMLDRADVPWKDEAKYDNWDRISEPLFKSLVTEPCAFAAVGEAGLNKLSIVGYDFYPSHAFPADGLSSRLKRPPQPPGYAYVALDGPTPSRFIGFSSVDAPFDHIVVDRGTQIETLPLGEEKFVFVIEERDGSLQRIETLDLAAE